MCGCQLSWCGCLICPILFSNCDGVGGIRNISLLDINVAFRIVLDVGLMLVVFLFALFGCLLFTLLGCLELVVGSLLFQPRRRHPKYLSAWHSVALRRRYYSRCSQTPPPTMLYLSHFFFTLFRGILCFFFAEEINILLLPSSTADIVSSFTFFSHSINFPFRSSTAWKLFWT